MTRFLATVSLLLAVVAGLSPRLTAAQATPDASSNVGTVTTTEFGPVPEGALGPTIPAEGYLVDEIGGGLYWVTEGRYQAIFLVTGEGVILVDAPPSFAANIPAAVASVTAEPITHLVYTHHHADHIAGASQIVAAAGQAGVEIIGHEDTLALLERSADPNRPVPTTTFADSYTLTVGSQSLELAYHGNNHESDNIFVYAPAQKVLMAVDIVFPGWVPFADLALAEDVPGFIDAHETILGYDFETFVGGHLTRLGTREDVETAHAYVLDVRANAANALGTV